MKSWFLPAGIAVFALISLIIIGSVRPDLVMRQAIFFVIGAAVFFLASRISFVQWMAWRWWIYAAVLLLLLLPLLLGHSSRNTSRWIELGFLRLQPSQLAIPLVGLTSIWFLDTAKLVFRSVVLFLATLMPPALIIFISPDLGTTVVFLTTLGLLLWYANVSVRHLLILTVIGVGIVTLSWFAILKPYQRERMLSFVAGTQAEEQQHYNATQALIAVGGGKVTGAGWGRGTQAQLQFLPERQTDFIFSSFSQEYGFIGTFLLIVLILLMTLLLFHFARKTAGKSAALYLLLSATTVFVQAGVNIGMNIGLLPITGVTLPLVSYGGSSILATCLMFGICSSILNHHEAPAIQVIT